MTDFETKDSGARAQFDSGMQRDTQDGKPRFDLMIPLNVPYEEQMITRLAALYGRGAVKYEDRNWEKANSEEEMARMKSSAFRHFMQWFCGETDEDHAAGTIFNIIAFETTQYKVDRNIDGLQPHELEAVMDIIEGRRAKGEVPNLTGINVHEEPEHYGPYSEEVDTPQPPTEEEAPKACDWGVRYFDCILMPPVCKDTNHREL